jgi:ribosome maturation factor RimP
MRAGGSLHAGSVVARPRSAVAAPDDYRRFAGRRAKIVLSEPVARQTAFAGRLRGLDGDEVLFESEGGKPVRLPYRLIARARSMWSSDLT